MSFALAWSKELRYTAANFASCLKNFRTACWLDTCKIPFLYLFYHDMYIVVNLVTSAVIHVVFVNIKKDFCTLLHFLSFAIPFFAYELLNVTKKKTCHLIATYSFFVWESAVFSKLPFSTHVFSHCKEYYCIKGQTFGLRRFGFNMPWYMNLN